jgi:hypothetical protein
MSLKDDQLADFLGDEAIAAEYSVYKTCTKSDSGYHCGEKHSNILSIKRKNIQSSEFQYNGIDRVDSSKGYYIDNCVPCCGICNTCKMDLTLDEFIKRSHIIANRHSVERNNYEV